MDSAATRPWIVSLQGFDGPLDLLLHLIKENQFDIFDIPIAAVTEQYLDYLDMMRVLNLEVAGEYLVMASELGLIKSRMLLPPAHDEEDCEQGPDPREELMRRLLEYRLFKEASLALAERDVLGRDTFTREAGEEPTQTVSPAAREIEKSDVWVLLGALRDILRRRGQRIDEPIELELEAYNIEEKMDEITDRLRRTGSLCFDELLPPRCSRFDIVVTFLAVLELVRTGVIEVVQTKPFSTIVLRFHHDG